MKSIIMAGGKGTRLGKVEKALIKIDDITLLGRVANALQDTDISVAVTKETPKTEKKAKEMELNTIITPGNGYHEDLLFLSKRFKEFLSASVDLPFLNKKLINNVIKKYNKIKKPICVVITKKDYQELGFNFSYSIGNLIPIGLNIIAQDNDYFYEIKGKASININTKHDLEEARKWI